MEVGLYSILALGFILGIKHAIEPDHVIAVSTIASQTKKLMRSSLAGVFWGIGHTATLFLVGIILILMKGEMSEKWAMSLEFLVGIMLVYIGISTILSFKDIHVHEHHADHKHSGDPGYISQPKDISHIKTFIIGLVHGLAGSGAMVLLTMGTVNTVWEGAVYILVFGVGTVIGMLFCTTLIGSLVVFGTKSLKFNKTFTQLTGVISTGFGFYYMYNLGIAEGLFKLWVQ